MKGQHDSGSANISKVFVQEHPGAFIIAIYSQTWQPLKQQ
jgi:hypothetical protein